MTESKKVSLSLKEFYRITLAKHEAEHEHEIIDKE